MVAALLGLAVAAAPAVGARAAGTVQVSHDGVTFGAAYPGVLFDGISTIIPGDTQSEVFYLRNSGPDAGFVRLVLHDTTGDRALTDSLSLRASVPSRAGPAVVLSAAAPCWVLNEGIFLAAGATVAVTAVLAFDATAGNSTQGSAADFGIGVSLTDTAVALPPTECGGSDATILAATPHVGALTSSGSELPIMLISVSAFITGIGLFFVLVAWRRGREDHAQTRGQ